MPSLPTLYGLFPAPRMALFALVRRMLIKSLLPRGRYLEQLSLYLSLRPFDARIAALYALTHQSMNALTTLERAAVLKTLTCRICTTYVHGLTTHILSTALGLLHDLLFSAMLTGPYLVFKAKAGPR
jgi:hypothetical protein